MKTTIKSIISYLCYKFSLKRLAYSSFVILFLVILCFVLISKCRIDAALFCIKLDRTSTILYLIGIVGLINWIAIGLMIFFCRCQLDRFLAHANYKRLIYFLLLIISIPSVIILIRDLLLLLPFRLSTPSSLSNFNTDIINPYLNHGEFTLSKSLISLLGTFLLSGVLVSMLVNFINQRAEKWKNGELRYTFRLEDYCVVIGGHDAVPSLVKQLVVEYPRVIVFSNREIPSYRNEVESNLDEYQKEKVTFYHGYRNSETDLKQLNFERENLKSIYILGESRVHGEEETSHDTLNMTCLDYILNLRSNCKERIECYVFFEYQTTSIIFQKYANNKKYKSLDFIPYNFYELQAQKAIGWHQYLNQKDFLRLDRFVGDSVNADKHVHLVVIGMSKIGQALGLEAIRVCHYPNYSKAQMLFEYGLDADAEKMMKKRRTKITFIDCNMKEILDSFRCKYGRLLNEIQWYYYDYNCVLNSFVHPLRSDGHTIVPDIELEFVNGRIQSENVIKHLTNISLDSSAVLSVASCLSKSNQSISSILCLPKNILEQAEIIVYQPDSTKLIDSIAINKKTEKIIAFGEKSQTVNLKHILAIESMAKRINNVYLKKRVFNNLNKKIELSDFSERAMRDFELDNRTLCDSAWTVKDKKEYEIDNWEMTETKRWSNRYHASAIWQKMHYIEDVEDFEKIVLKGITEDDGCVQEDFEGLLARTEHNRYCLEQWLLDRREPNEDVFKSYKCLKDINSPLTIYPTNDQIMTMAIPYIYGRENEKRCGCKELIMHPQTSLDNQ